MRPGRPEQRKNRLRFRGLRSRETTDTEAPPALAPDAPSVRAAAPNDKHCDETSRRLAPPVFPELHCEESGGTCGR
jgi:hypothetical protein